MRIRVNFDKMESDELVLGEPGEFDCALAARLLHGPPPALATAAGASALCASRPASAAVLVAASSPVAAFATDRLAIRREERHLTALFGPAWSAYADRVDRWFGRRMPSQSP